MSGIVGPSTDDPEWLMVGSMFDPESLAITAAVWHSENLRRGWSRADITPADRDRPEVLSDMTRLGATRVAVGTVGHGTDTDPLVFVYDAEAWSRVDDTDLRYEGEQTMTAVAAGHGVVAIGTGRGEDGDPSPRVWFSDDGLDWQLVAGGWSTLFNRNDQEVVTAVAGGAGGFVIVGWELVGERSDGLAWFSSDGRSWERVELPGQSPDRREGLLSVTAHGSGFVATGWTTNDAGHGVPVSWVSADGVTWTGPSVAVPQIADGRTTTMDLTASTVSSDGTTLVAGTGNFWRPHVWISTDGVNWAAGPAFTEQPDYATGLGLTAVDTAAGEIGNAGRVSDAALSRSSSLGRGSDQRRHARGRRPARGLGLGHRRHRLGSCWRALVAGRSDRVGPEARSGVDPRRRRRIGRHQQPARRPSRRGGPIRRRLGGGRRRDLHQ